MAAPIFADILKSAQTRQQAAIAPGVAGLEARRAPLEARFESLIERLKGREQTELTTAGREVSGQLERRGILGGSVPGRLLEQRTQPIRQSFTGEVSEAGALREQGLADIGLQILELRRGARTQAAQNALSLFQTRTDAFQLRRQRELDERESQRQRVADLRIAQLQARSGGGGGGATPTFTIPGAITKANSSNDLRDDIKNWLGGSLRGVNFLTFVQSYAPFMSIQQITSIYNQTAGRTFGRPRESRAQINQAFLRGKQGVAAGPVR